MDIESLMEALEKSFEDEKTDLPKGTVIGVIEDQIVLSGGGADTRAFIHPLEDGIRIEAHAAVEIDGEMDDDQLLKEANEALDEEVWPQLAQRGYETVEDDWNPELCILTRFGRKTLPDVPSLVKEISFLAFAELQEAFLAE